MTLARLVPGVAYPASARACWAIRRKSRRSPVTVGTTPGRTVLDSLRRLLVLGPALRMSSTPFHIVRLGVCHRSVEVVEDHLHFLVVLSTIDRSIER